MRHDDCIFCKIANGEIPSATIYEDDDFRAFLDLNPATRGHALLVPKDHFAVNSSFISTSHMKKRRPSVYAAKSSRSCPR